MRYLIAHELGHHYDFNNLLKRHSLSIILEPKPNDKISTIINRLKRSDENQFYADRFAFIVMGMDLYKKGKVDDFMHQEKEALGIKWLYVESNPVLYQYYADMADLWLNYWLKSIGAI